MDRYIVRRRETIVEPKSLETGRHVTKFLNVVFLTWSVIVIIMYFSSIDIPDYVDIGVSMFAVSVSVGYEVYKWYFFKESGIAKVMEDPDITLQRNINQGRMNRRQATSVQPIQTIPNLDNQILNLEDIKPNM